MLGWKHVPEIMCDGVTKGVKDCIAVLLSAKINNSYCSGETENY